MLKKINIMFHDDWEINGDGSGDPGKLMFDPAKRNLDICDKYNAKYTFFAEFGQQLAMLDSPLKMHQKWANEWETILKEAILRGHDVQLHFHPQWINASYKRGKWDLDFNKWALSSLSEKEIYYNLKKGKDYLENLFCSLKNNYRVIAFRAGGWYNQPSIYIYRSLINLGIKAEVSVRKGIIRDMGKIGKIDFSSAPQDKEYWYADENDFSKENSSNKGILEIPIYTKKLNIPMPFSLLKSRPSTFFYYLNFFIKNLLKEKSQTPPMLSKNKYSTMYCNFGLFHHLNLFDIVKDILKNNKYQSIPLIMLSHSKSFNSHLNFDKLLEKLQSISEVQFATTQDTIQKLENNNL